MTNGRNIENFLKSQPLFDVYQQYLWKFLIELQAEVSRFCCRILSFISYPLVIVLHLESFENNLIE